MLYFDGSLMATSARARVIIISPTGDRMEHAIRLLFQATNNVAEYEALIHGLKIASELGACRLFVREDSEMVVSQVMKEASCHDSKMIAYYDEVRRLEEKFNRLEFHHIHR
jgi:ribonuclease HI